MTKESIEKTNGPCVILAGAGTGKTHTIIEKLKYLITNKIYDPEKIVCITFSNEAANNLLTRIRSSINLEKEPIIKTFHSFSADLIKTHGSKAGMPTDFKILPPDEGKVLIHRSLRIIPQKCHSYMSTISKAKDLGIPPEALKEFIKSKIGEKTQEELTKECEKLQLEIQTLYLKKEKPEKAYKSKMNKKLKEVSNLLAMKKFVTAWIAYEKIKEKQNYLDYSDLNLRVLSLLQQVPSITNEFSYIIVDEFQDTNKIQLDILKALSPSKKITVVGDTNQSIYRFRGAYKDNLKIFKEDFSVKKEDVFNLAKSFRSPNTVLRSAHKLIEQNYENKEECFQGINAHKREGQKVEIYELKNAKEEARKIVDLIKSELESGKNPEDICILCRTHQQSVILRRTLENSGIQYTAASKSSLLTHPAVKTVIDYLTIVNSLSKKKSGSEQAWWDLIYQMDFLPEDLIKIGKFIKENRSSSESEESILSEKLLNALDSMPLTKSGKLLAKILKERILALLPKAMLPTNKILEEVYSLIGLEESKLNKKEITLNLNKLLELAQTQSTLYNPDLSSFIHYLSILGDLNIEIAATAAENPGVKIMTLHATKGLEYKTIILANMAQKRFPLNRIANNSLLPSEVMPELLHLSSLPEEEREERILDFETKNHLLEERRLCYVAFTRAKEKLIITYSKEYAGKKHIQSQFLNEIQYESNEDINFIKDDLEISQELKAKENPKTKFSILLQSQNFEDLLIESVKSSERSLEKKIKKRGSFSPSSLLAFKNCQKAYEYKYIYNMPDRKTFSWEAMLLGSFVHHVCELGVSKEFSSLKEFIDASKELHLSDNWASVDIDEAIHLITVFFERNKGKYSPASKTEQELKASIGGFQFIGFADRIDFHPEGIEIIDYKTGKSPIAPVHRNWQLGFYALAAKKIGKVNAITLDMLKQDKPLQFAVDSQGNAKSKYGEMAFNINNVEKELIETAQEITNAYEQGFKPCQPEKNCDFCNEYIYGF